MLKQCSPVIEEYLSEASKNSIMEKNSDFSKLPKFVPSFKKGDQTRPENYSPLSLLRSVNKIFKKLLYNLMIHFLMKNKLFRSYPFEYQKKDPAFKQLEL